MVLKQKQFLKILNLIQYDFVFSEHGNVAMQDEYNTKHLLVSYE